MTIGVAEACLRLVYLASAVGCGSPRDQLFPAEGGGAWIIGVLPDTQKYAELAPETFAAETALFVSSLDEGYDIGVVLHVGDIVERNTPEQWQVAQDAMLRLAPAIPFVLAVGNPDMGEGGSARDRSTWLNEFFAPSDFPLLAADGFFEPGRLENTFHTMDRRGERWLFLSLEFGPRADVLAWAEGVLRAHPDYRTVLITHAYLYFDGTRYDAATADRQMWDPSEYGVADLPGGAAQAEEVFQRLVRPFGQVELVLCGHVLDTGVARLTSAQDDGGFVHQVLANYQHTDTQLTGIVRFVEVDNGMRRFRFRTHRLGRGLDTAPAHTFDLPMDR